SQIIYKNGVVRSLRMYSLDLNHIASSDIAKDKGYAKFFMEKRGYPVAPGVTVLKDSWAKAIKSKKNTSFGIRNAEKIGYPLVAKPNSKSQGVDVSVVWNRKELVSILYKIFKGDRIAVVEKYLPGHDYRIVVLDKEIISAYERLALSVVGDGEHSVLALLKQKQKDFIAQGRDTKINFNDQRIKIKLQKQGYSFGSILLKDESVYLLDNANLSTGGDAIDVTNTIHSNFRKIAIELTRDMGLRISGVDIMVTKGDITMNPKNCEYYIIEINSAPGLDHYVTTGDKQRKIVEAMYFKVFKALARTHT
ncbi:MAG: cyanophycin synthetase, partial [bacterium]